MTGKSKKVGQAYKRLTAAKKANNQLRRKIKIRRQMQQNKTRVISA